MTIINTLNELAILNSGRNPQWSEQASASGAPTTLTEGVALDGAVVALLALDASTSGECRVWVLPQGRDAWFTPAGGELISFDGPWVQRAIVAGFRRAYIEVLSGSASALVGPCLLED